MNLKKTGNILAYFISNLLVPFHKGNINCRPDVYKLVKLLYFLDSRFYMLYGRTITELEYAKLIYGPAPDNYEMKLSQLSEAQYIELVTQEDYPYYINKKEADLSVFEKDEIELLEDTLEGYGNKKFGELVDISHDEDIYKNNSIGSNFDFNDFSERKEAFLLSLEETQKAKENGTLFKTRSGDELLKHLS